jgi:hypothetical protein
MEAQRSRAEQQSAVRNSETKGLVTLMKVNTSESIIEVWEAKWEIQQPRNCDLQAAMYIGDKSEWTKRIEHMVNIPT